MKITLRIKRRDWKTFLEQAQTLHPFETEETLTERVIIEGMNAVSGQRRPVGFSPAEQQSRTLRRTS